MHIILWGTIVVFLIMLGSAATVVILYCILARFIKSGRGWF